MPHRADALPRTAILALAEQYGLHNVRVFGSAARGAQTAESDLDLLVSAPAGRSLLDVVAFGQAVEDVIGRPVDVVTDEGLSPYLRDRILAGAVPL